MDEGKSLMKDSQGGRAEFGNEFMISSCFQASGQGREGMFYSS